MAIAFGANSDAMGNNGLAAAVGRMLDATATGTHQLVNFVFQP